MAIKTKEELINEYYQEEVEFLQSIAERHAIKEEELFPKPWEGWEIFEYDLSICLIEGIRLKGKRWIKNHKTTTDMEEIREALWKWVTKTKVPSELYGEIRDDETYYILNEKFKEEYDCLFTNEKALKTQVNNAKSNSCRVDVILHKMAQYVHHGIQKNPKWLEVVERGDKCFLGTKNE